VKVFISWSKEPSRTTAHALARWLSELIQVVEPWVSDREIASGQRWRGEIATALLDIDFGIICLTKANQHNPWLMFEAGALAKHLPTSRVVPLYIDLSPAEVTGPLEEWQGQALDRDGIWNLVQDINKVTPKPVPEQGLAKLFGLVWPDLQTTVAEAKKHAPTPEGSGRKPDEMLEELVTRVRRIERDQLRPFERRRRDDTIMFQSAGVRPS
jgi:hypothetical protein